MEVIPAIDLMKGRAVRLLRGYPKSLKSYGHLGEPLEIARRWKAEGGKMIQIIDLDAALGLGSNESTIMQIINDVDAPTQVGGGIRSLERACSLLEEGVERIIVGSLAFESPLTLRKLLDEFGRERVVVALDHKNEVVVTRGWMRLTSIGVKEALKKFMGMGAKLFLVTSVSRDGSLEGPNIETLAKLCNFSGADIISAGGVGRLSDLIALKKIGVKATVIGKALYEGCFKLSDALKVAEDGEISAG